MKRNRFWAAVSKVLAVVTVTLITALLLVPGASAASKSEPWVQLGEADPIGVPGLCHLRSH